MLTRRLIVTTNTKSCFLLSSTAAAVHTALRFCSTNNNNKTPYSAKNQNPEADDIIAKAIRDVEIMKSVLYNSSSSVNNLTPQEQAHLQFLKSENASSRLSGADLWKEINRKENLVTKMQFDLAVKDDTLTAVHNLKEGATKTWWRVAANLLGLPLLLYCNYILYKWVQTFHGLFGGNEVYQEVEKCKIDKDGKARWF